MENKPSKFAVLIRIMDEWRESVSKTLSDAPTLLKENTSTPDGRGDVAQHDIERKVTK